MKNYLFILIVFFVASCVPTSPSDSLIETVPVIKVGESKTVPSDHIIFIPANTEFPIHFSVRGTIFNNEINSEVLASFKKDMYLYKYWASLDGKKWVHSHELMTVEPSGGFDKSGGKVEVKLDLNE